MSDSQFLIYQAPAGKVSRQKALKKSSREYDKYKATRKRLQREESLRELEQDIKRLKPPRNKDPEWTIWSEIFLKKYVSTGLRISNEQLFQ